MGDAGAVAYGPPDADGRPVWELRQGRWQDVLTDVEHFDALITDPPYSDRTHAGQRTGSSVRSATIHYTSLQEGECAALVAFAAERCAHWSLVFSDHLGAREWEAEFSAAGWYVFAPVIHLRTCPAPRLAGDGPTSAADYITVARPRRRTLRPGHRPGYYLVPGGNGIQLRADKPHPGGKRTDIMRAIVRDYSRRGDLVCDPCAGGATTLLAAVMEGRRAIGAECDPDTFALAVKRLRRGYTPDLFTAAAPTAVATQTAMFSDGGPDGD